MILGADHLSFRKDRRKKNELIVLKFNEVDESRKVKININSSSKEQIQYFMEISRKKPDFFPRIL